jgi:hypothetical protein
MATSRAYTSTQMPAAAGHSWLGARPFAIAETNDLPRGS